MEHQKDCKKVLFVLGSMEVGGVQSGVLNFAKIIPGDVIRFDVLVTADQIGFHEEAFKQYGNVYHIPLRSPKGKLTGLLFNWINDWIFARRFRAFLKEHRDYDVVHAKILTRTGVVMKVAKECGVPVRVAQSHVDKPDRLNPISQFYYSRQARVIEKYATHKLAVSPKAVDLLYGKFGGRVIKNPTISLERLDPTKYRPEPHEGIRLIQIGTYSHRKNQVFSVRILKSLIEKEIPAQLTFVGFPLDEPEYIHEVEAEVEGNGLSDRVAFLPKDSDVPALLSESDYMLIPSLREGLPNVALESQAMGVPCFISDTVNPETDCGLCSFLPLESGADAWAQAILEYRAQYGAEKRYIDMSEWDNKKVCEAYIRIWRGEE